MAHEQRRFAEAEDAYKQALEIFVAFEDRHARAIVLRSLARLWRATGSAVIPALVAAALKISPTEAEELLSESLTEADKATLPTDESH